tara:strand:- start:2053 stop:2379 length:327 start_codon:yes stop_codon:yes gene_type:complete
MAATWKIAACDRTMSLGGEADVITDIHWTVTDEETVNDVVHSGRRYSSVSLDTSDLSSFTAYASVTEANAIEWAKEALGSDEVTRIEAAVAAEITLSKTPTHGTGVPW